jgi:type II secretory pathway pseudopilin PulG
MIKTTSNNPHLRRPRGFTMIELLVGGTIMLLVIVAALAVYSRSNQISVDQQQYTELQHDVRSAMYLIMRDIRMAGSGFPEQLNMFAVDGVDNDDSQSDPAGVEPDRLILMGNIDDPFVVQTKNYDGQLVDKADLPDGALEEYPYPDDFYVNRYILILPNPTTPSRGGEVRKILNIPSHTGGTNEFMNFVTGLAGGEGTGIKLPGSMSPLLANETDNYTGGSIMFVDVKEYWLDVTGNVTGTTFTAANGYLGQPGVLYQTKNGVHYPIAQNIENFQVQYNGDFDDNGFLDGFRDWDDNWVTLAPNPPPDDVSRIRQVRVILLGRTPNRFVSVSGRPGADIHLYRRPFVANSSGTTTDDLHRRFLLESTSNIRNLSLNLYNRGVR